MLAAREHQVAFPDKMTVSMTPHSRVHGMICWTDSVQRLVIGFHLNTGQSTWCSLERLGRLCMDVVATRASARVSHAGHSKHLMTMLRSSA